MDAKQELCKDIPDYEGLYQAADSGRIKSIRNKKPKFLSPYQNVAGVYVVHFTKDGIQKIIPVKKLVAVTFLGANKELDQFRVCNIDGCEWNNEPENLMITIKDAPVIKEKTERKVNPTKGVTFQKSSGKHISTIWENKKSHYVGSFDTREEAVGARNDANILEGTPRNTKSVYKEKESGKKYIAIQWKSRYKKWYSQIWNHDKILKLGSYTTKKHAQCAFNAAKKGNFNWEPKKIDGRSLRYKGK